MKRSSALVCCVGVLLSFAASTQAVTLIPDAWTALPGTTAAAEPQLAGVVIVDDLQPFSFSAYGGTVSGQVQVRIVRSSVDNTLDFYWVVSNDETSAGLIQDLRLGGFVSPEYNANYRTDGLGTVGPDRAFLFPSPPWDGYINFNFSDGLAPGATSRFFFFDTTATSYARTAVYDLTNTGQTEISVQYETYAPAAVPEPATMLLLGSGLLGLTRVRRRR